MENKIDITETEKRIIIDYLSGNLSPEDSIRLTSWLERDEKNRALFEKLSEIWRSVNFMRYRDTINVEKAWNEINHHLSRQTKSKSGHWLTWGMVAAIAMFALITGAIGNHFLFHRVSHPETTLAFEYSAPVGSRSFVKMPDGSEIWLNAGSTLTYENGYGQNHRAVHLSGEAFFNITKDSVRPFTVHTDDINIKVLGTTFLVTAYANDLITQTYLEAGSIELKPTTYDKVIRMAPGEEAIFQKDDRQITIEKNQNPNRAAWRFGQISFYNKPFKDITNSLERNFGVQFQFEEKKLEGIKLTMEFEDEGISEIVNYISTLTNLKITKRQNSYLIKSKL